MKFIYKPCVCDKDVMKPDEIITNGSLVQEAIREYHHIVASNQWENTDIKKESQDEPLVLKAFNL